MATAVAALVGFRQVDSPCFSIQNLSLKMVLLVSMVRKHWRVCLTMWLSRHWRIHQHLLVPLPLVMLVPDLFSSLESSSKHVLYFLLSLFLLVALNFTIGLFCFIYFHPFGKYKIYLDIAYFAENWKYYSKIIFKRVNSSVEPIFNEKIAEKWNL